MKGETIGKMLLLQVRESQHVRQRDRWGNLEHHRLGTDAIRRILAHRGRRARLPRARTGAAAAAKPA